MTNKDRLSEWINDEWEKKRIKCKEVRSLLNISRKTWSVIWSNEEFVEEMKSHRVKVGFITKDKKNKYLIKY